jgi:hypothetical protein
VLCWSRIAAQVSAEQKFLLVHADLLLYILIYMQHIRPCETAVNSWIELYTDTGKGYPVAQTSVLMYIKHHYNFSLLSLLEVAVQ